MALEEKLKKYQEDIKQKPLTSATILIVLLVFLLIAVPYLDVNHRGINNATVEATLENQDRATLAQIFGGVAIAIGLYYTWRRIAIAEENLKVAQDNLKVTQENLEATQKVAQDNLKVAQEGQITERFTRAVDQLGATDQLGNPAIEIRLGGIYALERISNESESECWPIMEILTAYVRKNSSAEIVGNKKNTSLAIDIQVALTVIGRRKYSFDNTGPATLNLQEVYLCGADLRGADLEWADLQGAHLERTDLRGAKLGVASLEGAILKENNLKGAHLEEADLGGADLGGADLGGAYLKLADLKRAHLEDANLEDANLENANLKGAKNLTVDQLSKAKTLYQAQLDEGLEEELRAKGFGKLIDDEPKRRTVNSSFKSGKL